MIYKDSIIIIPARLKSKRLKNKQLQEINGIPLIKRVVEEVKKMNLCDFIVATDSKKIKSCIEGENVIITNKKLNSGSDRCFDALQKIKNKKYKYIVDLKSDMLNIDKKIIDDILINLHNKNIDIITAVYKTKDEKQKQQQQSVKVAINYNKSDVIHKCLYFSRSNIPFSNKTAYIHIGIYGYSVKSLIKFANFAIYERLFHFYFHFLLQLNFYYLYCFHFWLQFPFLKY